MGAEDHAAAKTTMLGPLPLETAHEEPVTGVISKSSCHTPHIGA
jgi:hypothetical protein